MVDQNKIEVESKKLVVLSHTLLKKEWKRVKRGEPSFFYTKYFFLVGVPLIILLAFFNKSTIYNCFEKSSNNSSVVSTNEQLKDAKARNEQPVKYQEPQNKEPEVDKQVAGQLKKKE